MTRIRQQQQKYTRSEICILLLSFMFTLAVICSCVYVVKGARQRAAAEQEIRLAENDSAANDIAEQTGEKYILIEKEKLNDGIHITNQAQRNSAFEELMREIADKTQ